MNIMAWKKMMAVDGDGGGRGDENEGEGGAGKEKGDTTDVEKLIDSKVNAAISTHLSRFRTSLEKDIGGTIAKSLEPFGAKLEALGNKPLDEGKKKDKEAIDEDRRKDQARIADLENKYSEEKKQREAEASARAREEERGALQTALRTAGIEDNRLRAAVALIYGEDQRVGRADNGDIVFKVQKAGYVDEVTLDDGIGDWLKSDEGKTFLPARGAAGSGASGSNHQRKKGATTKEERIAEARHALLAGHGMATE